MAGRNPSAFIGRNPSPRLGFGGGAERESSRVALGDSRISSLDDDPNSILVASSVDGPRITWEIDTSVLRSSPVDGATWYWPLTSVDGQPVNLTFMQQWVALLVHTPPADASGVALLFGICDGPIADLKDWFGGIEWRIVPQRTLAGNGAGWGNGAQHADLRTALLHSAAVTTGTGNKNQKRLFSIVSGQSADGTNLSVTERTGTVEIDGVKDVYIFVTAVVTAAVPGTAGPFTFEVLSMISPTIKPTV